MGRHAKWWLGCAIALLSGSVAQAQGKYRTEQVQDHRIEFKVFEKLHAIPLRIGEGDKTLKARFEPQDASDYIFGRGGTYKWELYVRSFERVSTAVTGEGDDEEAPPANQTEAILRAMGRTQAKSFDDWVRNEPGRDNREFLTEGKEIKKRGKTPAHKLYEYYDTDMGFRGEVEWYKIAAVYDIDGYDVVMLCNMPVKKDHRPDRKWANYAKSMVQSVKLLDPDEVEGEESNEKKDAFADSPSKQEALDAAKKNISNLGNWDYHLTPHYIVLFSWEDGKRAARRESTAFAKVVGRKMEEIRELFAKDWPPEDREFPYSIIRVCSDYDEFSSYGNTPRGVVGWFSPGTKELVIFYDADRIFGPPEGAIQVSYHEAWHQYADSFFPNVELHRWWDEGMAEYYAQFEKKGSKYRRSLLDGRYRSIRNQLNVGTEIAVGEIIYWPRSLFYGPRAADHYAQAYSMMDFLTRGKSKLKSKWDDDWDKIIDKYAEVALQKGAESDTPLSTDDLKVAVDAAFEGVDVEEFSEAWKTWVTKHMK